MKLNVQKRNAWIVALVLVFLSPLAMGQNDTNPLGQFIESLAQENNQDESGSGVGDTDTVDPEEEVSTSAFYESDENGDDVLVLDGVELNEVVQFLAKEAGY